MHKIGDPVIIRTGTDPEEASIQGLDCVVVGIDQVNITPTLTIDLYVVDAVAADGGIETYLRSRRFWPGQLVPESAIDRLAAMGCPACRGRPERLATVVDESSLRLRGIHQCAECGRSEAVDIEREMDERAING